VTILIVVVSLVLAFLVGVFILGPLVADWLT
jgi:hypothetical protein